MLVNTTYQNDYGLPYTKRYDFILPTKPLDKKKNECQCRENINISKITENQDIVAWTQVATMGPLIEPRIIPANVSSDQLDALSSEKKFDCFKEQPNRFLNILRTAYPDLYERLKEIPKDELNRYSERDQMYTTYQVDFCNINEYGEGIYTSLNPKDEISKLNANKLLRMKECEGLRNNVMFASSEISGRNNCEKVYKPFKISFSESCRFINSGNNSHWHGNIFNKRTKSTEYMDTINKIGCVILKNNIHNHQKCTEKSCKHQLTHTCRNLK